MTVDDLVTLTKAGYTPEFLAKLMGVETEKKEPAKVDLKEEPVKEEPKKDPEPETKEEPEKEQAPEIDYKKLYEEEQEKVKKLQASKRSENISKNVPDDIEAHVISMFKDFF